MEISQPIANACQPIAITKLKNRNCTKLANINRSLKLVDGDGKLDGRAGGEPIPIDLNNQNYTKAGQQKMEVDHIFS